MKIWVKTEEFSEGKYLVVRRDGTAPAWPHFVIGGDDPCAPGALEQYAEEAAARGFDPEYVASIRELAIDFLHRRGGKADPDAGPHRKDLPLALAMMRRETDVARVADEIERLRDDFDRLMSGHRKTVSAMCRLLMALKKIQLHDGLETREATVRAQRKIAADALEEYELGIGAI